VRRLSKSPAVLSVVLSIGLLIQGFVDHVSPDKIPLAVASTAATSIIGGVKSRTIGEETRPVLFRSLDEASWFFTEKKSLFQVRSFSRGGFTPPSYPEYTLFVCIRVSISRVVSHGLGLVSHL
jgi:hypothetical protein